MKTLISAKCRNSHIDYDTLCQINTSVSNLKIAFSPNTTDMKQVD